MPEISGYAGRTPETHVIDFRAAEQLLTARDPRGAVKLLDGVIAAHPENTAARLLRARAFFAAAQLRPAELEFTIVLEREPDNAFAHFALARTYERSQARLSAPAGPARPYVTSGSRLRWTPSRSIWPRRASTPEPRPPSRAPLLSNAPHFPETA